MTNRAGVMKKVCNKGETRNVCEIQRPKYENTDKDDVRQNFWLTNVKKRN